MGLTFHKHLFRLAAGPLLLAVLSACTMEETADVTRAQGQATGITYDGITTRLLDGDLVNFHVEMTGATSRADVDEYARCAAAQYALIRGYGFARHVRTNVEIIGSNWTGDAVYTVSPALPAGVKAIDAEVTIAACEENQIPTV